MPTRSSKVSSKRVESAIQRDVELAIGTEPDIILMRNSVGNASYVNAETGQTYRVPYGLMVGSPDLVGILAPNGRWFCLEMKRPGEAATEEQRKIHAAWRRFGAFVATVTSVPEAVSALKRARSGASE